VICGMHVHVGIEDEHLRIDLMNQVKYMLPHLLALSSSSPFWDGTPTGLLAYRLVIFQNMPRTGLPEEFVSWGEYQRYLGALVDAGLIEDSSKLWWHIRPSGKYPTLEMRISDVCTRLDDAMTVAALYQCILGYLYRLRRRNQKWRTYRNGLLDENIWRAQRYGSGGTLVDFGRGELVSMVDLIDELLGLVHEEVVEFDVVDETERARTIVAEGTSAHRQLDVYQATLDAEGEERDAMIAVVDHLIADSMHGIDN
jgi:glutamate---cysteine ligase / carboxylate-amine ligase